MLQGQDCMNSVHLRVSVLMLAHRGVRVHDALCRSFVAVWDFLQAWCWGLARAGWVSYLRGSGCASTGTSEAGFEGGVGLNEVVAQGTGSLGR